MKSSTKLSRHFIDYKGRLRNNVYMFSRNFMSHASTGNFTTYFWRDSTEIMSITIELNYMCKSESYGDFITEFSVFDTFFLSYLLIFRKKSRHDMYLYLHTGELNLAIPSKKCSLLLFIRSKKCIFAPNIPLNKCNIILYFPLNKCSTV